MFEGLKAKISSNKIERLRKRKEFLLAEIGFYTEENKNLMHDIALMCKYQRIAYPSCFDTDDVDIVYDMLHAEHPQIFSKSNYHVKPSHDCDKKYTEEDLERARQEIRDEHNSIMDSMIAEIEELRSRD